MSSNLKNRMIGAIQFAVVLIGLAVFMTFWWINSCGAFKLHWQMFWK